jgi:hypothetical protein
MLNRLATLPVKAPFHSIIGHLWRRRRTGTAPMELSIIKTRILDGAESEKIVPAGHGLIVHPETVSEIKRLLEENIASDPRKAQL